MQDIAFFSLIGLEFTIFVFSRLFFMHLYKACNGEQCDNTEKDKQQTDIDLLFQQMKIPLTGKKHHLHLRSFKY